MNHDLPPRRVGPPDDPPVQCPCGYVLTDHEHTECSGCKAYICDECADEHQCLHNACENAYCKTCAPRWLPKEAAGVCIFCVNARHQVQLGRFFAAATEGY